MQRELAVLTGRSWLILAGLLLAVAHQASGQILGSEFQGLYSVRDLGIPASVPYFGGSILFKAGDPATLLVGGSTDGGDSEIYQLKVQRDAQGHLTGFSGGPTLFAHAPGNPAAMDVSGLHAGLDYGPNGVLFYATFDGSIAQIKPGDNGPSRFIRNEELGIDGRVSGLVFVPPDFPGVGRLKLTGYNWWDTTLGSTSSGAYDILKPGVTVDLSDATGLVYVKAGLPGFTKDSVLATFDQDGVVIAYEVDDNGDPILTSARTFLSDFWPALGAIRDPLTGDLVFSNSDVSQSRIVIVGRIAVSAPQITLTSPNNGARFRAPAFFSVAAEAKEDGGLIARVEFYQGTTLIATIPAPGPFWTQKEIPSAGEYDYHAIAYDASGLTATSSVAHVSVVNDGPIVTLQYPTNNTTLPVCADLTLAARVQPGNSAVARVEFRDGSTVLGTFTVIDAFKPMSLFVWHVNEGPHVFSVSATDKNGLITTVAATNVMVQPLPMQALNIHHYQPGELMFCFRGQAGTKYVWERSDSLIDPVWRPFLTNTAPADVLRMTNEFHSPPPAGFFRTRRMD